MLFIAHLIRERPVLPFNERARLSLLTKFQREANKFGKLMGSLLMVSNKFRQQTSKKRRKVEDDLEELHSLVCELTLFVRLDLTLDDD